jgi:hypothetical protein
VRPRGAQARAVDLTGGTPCGGRAQRLNETMRAAHALAWQSRRGARHKAPYVNPKGAQRSSHQAKRERSDWGDLHIRRPYVKARGTRDLPRRGCAVAWHLTRLTAARGGKRRQERALLT